jgi:hypothetical protein
MDGHDILYDIILSLVIAGITFLATCGWKAIKKRRLLRRLAKCFGKGAHSVGNVYLCLPLLSLIATSRNECRFEKRDFTGDTYSFFGPSKTLSYQDVQAGQEVASIFNEFFSDPMEMIFDDGVKDLEDKTVFFIGSPISNFFVKHLFERLRQPFIDFLDQEETDEHKAAIGFIDLIDNKIYDSGGANEYSVIIRMSNPESEGNYFFVLCGAHAAGTFAAARYLKRNWSEFKSAEDAAVIVLGMPRGCYQLAQVERRHGFGDS